MKYLPKDWNYEKSPARGQAFTLIELLMVIAYDIPWMTIPTSVGEPVLIPQN